MRTMAQPSSTSPLNMTSLSFYDTGVTAAYGDKLITLSTCEYSRNNSRLVVVAKRIVEGGDADAAQTHAEAAAESQRLD